MIQNYILEVNVLILWYVYDAKKNEFNKIEDMHYKNTKKSSIGVNFSYSGIVSFMNTTWSFESFFL